MFYTRYHIPDVIHQMMYRYMDDIYIYHYKDIPIVSMDSPRTWRAAPRRLHAWVAWPWWSPATKCSGAGTELNGRTKRNRKWSKCRGYGWFMADLGWFMLIYGWFMADLWVFCSLFWLSCFCLGDVYGFGIVEAVCADAWWRERGQGYESRPKDRWLMNQQQKGLNLTKIRMYPNILVSNIDWLFIFWNVGGRK